MSSEKIKKSEIFGCRLEEVRESVGLNQLKFSEKLGIPQQSYINYKKGRTPPVELLLKIREFWGVSSEWLLTGSGPMFLDSNTTTLSHLEGDNRATSSNDRSNEPHGSEPPESQNAAPNKGASESELRALRQVLRLSEENAELRAKVAELEATPRREGKLSPGAQRVSDLADRLREEADQKARDESSKVG